MCRFRSLSFVLAVLLFSLTILSCNGIAVFSNGRLLVVVSVNPSNVNAQTFSGGVVQFTATGNFNMDPVNVTPLSGVIWTVDSPAFSGVPDDGHATISMNGVAQCAPEFSGTVTIIATAAKDPSQPVSMSNEMSGSTVMMCP